MTQIQNESVHLIVTSPPYWQLKDYGTKNQIGFNDTYEAYINIKLFLYIQKSFDSVNSLALTIWVASYGRNQHLCTRLEVKK